MKKSFEELKISEDARVALKKMGVIEPTPVQEAAIPVVRKGEDVVVQAQTGTGKTLAFLLPIMEKIKSNVPVTQALVVAPTRELALQITKVAKKIGEVYGVTAATMYGGQAVERQTHKLDNGVQLVIGTPGRILDLVRRRKLILANVNRVVLDEADEMLHMGFIEDVETILKETASDRQLMFFSATIPDRIRGLARHYMRSPQDIKIESENITLDDIEQVIVDTNEDTKLSQLCTMINEMQPYLAMVFCHTKQRVSQVAAELAKRGYMVDELHGDLTQAKRTLVMRRFASAKLQILVATDIAARGIDVEGVTHVFNYDVPHDTESYIHRIGRTGRAGQKGMAVTFVNARQYELLRQIERGIKSRLSKKENSVKKRREEQDKLQQHQERAKQEKAAEKASLSKYSNRKGSEHGGKNFRSRRQADKPKSLDDIAKQIGRRRGGKRR